jgi:hypothetical protein
VGGVLADTGLAPSTGETPHNTPAPPPTEGVPRQTWIARDQPFSRLLVGPPVRSPKDVSRASTGRLGCFALQFQTNGEMNLLQTP